MKGEKKTPKKRGYPETESVRKLRENFVEIRRNYPEKTIQEIADDCNVSVRHTYTVINRISKETGIPKAELLFTPHKKHQKRMQTAKRESVNVECITEQIMDAIIQTESIIAKIEEAESKNQICMEE